MIQQIVETRNAKELVGQFKKIVLLSYGQKSADGRRFIKSEELREEFSQTAAYEKLFMELAENAESAATFLNGVLPKDLTAPQNTSLPGVS
jgi:hypothetical protein